MGIREGVKIGELKHGDKVSDITLIADWVDLEAEIDDKAAYRFYAVINGTQITKRMNHAHEVANVINLSYLGSTTFHVWFYFRQDKPQANNQMATLL